MSFAASWPYLAVILFVCVYALLDWAVPRLIAGFEEGFISIILAGMTLLAFVQVVLRYGFNSGIAGALELNRIMFAWLILFGMSYAVRINAHLGIDSVIRLFPRPVFRRLALVGAAAGVLYGVALLSADWTGTFGATTRGGGAIDYWHRMWRIGIGLDDLSYPPFLQEMFGQQRVHRWVAYLVLPLGLGLFTFRCLQALVQIARGRRTMIIAGHEAEDLVREGRAALRERGGAE